MINQICESLTNKIRQEMPDIDDEEAEVIKYGLELIIGEVPKILLLFIIAIVLKIGWLVIFAYFTMLPYKIVAGGFHLKTNIGCTIGTLSIYYGNVLISKYITWTQIYTKYIVILIAFVFSMIMVSLYAPADTVNLPILTKRERKTKRILSYVFPTIILLVAIIIKDNILSNILLLNVLIESICISKVAYKLTKNEYGYENYLKELKVR